MKQVMVVRTELKMRKGKIAAQCCHGSLGAYKRSDKDKIRKWENEAYGKYSHFLCEVGDFIVASSGVKVEYIDKATEQTLDELKCKFIKQYLMTFSDAPSNTL